MHDTPDQVHWHEPKAGENAGFGRFERPRMPYDRFMEAEGVPVYRGIGVRRVQDLPLAPWRRLGGRDFDAFARATSEAVTRLPAATPPPFPEHSQASEREESV